MNRKVWRWEAAGVVWTFLLGSALHFLFEWTGCCQAVAWAAAVNESTWEHMKLSFWPGLLFALLEYRALGGEANNFWAGKGIGLFTAPALIAVGFHGYTAILDNSFPLNILLFLISIVAGQLISYRILTSPEMRSPLRVAAVILLVLTITAFAVFSYLPPEVFLFQDPVTGQFGIP